MKEYEVFFKGIMNHIPNNIIRNPKLINLIKIMISKNRSGKDQKIRMVSSGYYLNDVRKNNMESNYDCYNL